MSKELEVTHAIIEEIGRLFSTVKDSLPLKCEDRSLQYSKVAGFLLGMIAGQAACKERIAEVHRLLQRFCGIDSEIQQLTQQMVEERLEAGESRFFSDGFQKGMKSCELCLYMLGLNDDAHKASHVDIEYFYKSANAKPKKVRIVERPLGSQLCVDLHQNIQDASSADGMRAEGGMGIT